MYTVCNICDTLWEKGHILAQAMIFAMYIPDDRAKNCLRIDMLSVRIPRSMHELWALETQSCSNEKTHTQNC